jgi:hypothetical protein
MPVNPRPSRGDQLPEGQMNGIFQWIIVAFGVAIIAFGMAGFFRGFSLPPNSPEHRSHGKGDSWRT